LLPEVADADFDRRHRASLCTLQCTPLGAPEATYSKA
jgi:hypothetical protein